MRPTCAAHQAFSAYSRRTAEAQAPGTYKRSTAIKLYAVYNRFPLTYYAPVPGSLAVKAPKLPTLLHALLNSAQLLHHAYPTTSAGQHRQQAHLKDGLPQKTQEALL